MSTVTESTTTLKEECDPHGTIRALRADRDALRSILGRAAHLLDCGQVDTAKVYLQGAMAADAMMESALDPAVANGQVMPKERVDEAGDEIERAKWDMKNEGERFDGCG